MPPVYRLFGVDPVDETVQSATADRNWAVRAVACTRHVTGQAARTPKAPGRCPSDRGFAMPPPFDLAHAAVVAMDCPSGLVRVYAAGEPDAFAQRAAGILRAARTARKPVVHVQIGFRPGLPEVSARNRLLAAIKTSPKHQQLFAGAAGAIHPALGAEPSDIVVLKHRVSAFTGTDLELIVRAQDIDTLVLFGIATSGVVLSTVLDASDRDLQIVVIADCCADLDAELHRVLITSLFPKRGVVVSAQEFVHALETS